MRRPEYFAEIDSLHSPLLLLSCEWENIIQIRTNDLSESLEGYFAFADKLFELDVDIAKTRSQFISMQCRGIESEKFFEQHRESWGIPKFREDLVTVGDFKNGFIHTFRDHSTSWCEDFEAREWFYKSPESRFVRHYQFWACDNGSDEILLRINGDYKSILWTIVNDHQDYSPLISPVFTTQELEDFYESFEEDISGFTKEDLLDILKQNPNWS
jgi:hypothetical protein